MEIKIYLFISEVDKKTAIWDMISSEYSLTQHLSHQFSMYI